MPAPTKGMPTFYDMVRLHRVFFILSALWFVLLVFMVWQDYRREWHRYQREFRKVEMERARLALREAEQSPEAQKLRDLRAQLRQVEQRLAAKKDEIRALERELAGLEARRYVEDQQWRFAKSERDSLRYVYEVALNENRPDVEKRRQRLEEAERKVDTAFEALKALDAQIDRVRQELARLTGERVRIEKELQLIAGKVEALEKRLGELKPSLVNYLRDLPLLDFMVPYFQIRQVYLSDLYYDVNFRLVERADRCMTCHLAIDRPDFQDYRRQPFKAHPKLDLMVGGASPHPVESFGCTICHMGRDRGTTFVTAAHTPRDDVQKRLWEAKYDWKPMELWEDPQLPLQYAEATCLMCHQGQLWVRGADRLNRGLDLIRRAGCYGCHKIPGFEYLRKAGPSLEKIAAKTTPEWVFRWIKDPQSFRPTWMPKFFDLTNTRDEYYRRRNHVEALAITAYLFEKSQKETYPPVPVPGDPARGEQLVKNLGCLGCHTLDPQDWARTDSVSRRKFGPNLAYMGSKVRPEWLFAWLKDPKAYWPKTRMPNLRLSDQEAADITAYLMSQRNPAFEAARLPVPDESILDEIAAEQWINRMTASEIQVKLRQMSLREKLVFVGERMIARYGCFGCHDIPGFETTQAIGTELSEEGDKPIVRLDFGYQKIPHTRWDWFRTKLKDPRIFDVGREVKPWEKLRMPQFAFSDDDIDAIVTVLLGLKKTNILGPTKVRRLTPREEAVWAGWRILEEHNCIGCHQVGYVGGDIRGFMQEAGIEPGLWPPILKYEDRLGPGAKVRTDWLYQFLKDPYPIRVWLQVRMPTFGLTDEEVNTLIRAFASMDNVTYPFEEAWYQKPPQDYVAMGKVLFDKLQCIRCHIVSAQAVGTGEAAAFAPNLELVRSRLRPDWLVQWLKDPNAIMPGTRMPTYPWGEALRSLDPSIDPDPNKQILAVRNYLLNFSAAASASAPTATRPALTQRTSP